MITTKLKTFSFAQFYWFAIQISKRLGWSGLAGIFLLLLALVVYLTQVMPMRESLESSYQTLLEKKTIHNTSVELEANKPTAQQSSETLIADIYAEFPSKGALSSVLKVLQQTAVKHKLDLVRGDYKFTQMPTNAGMARYEIQLPLSGQYPQLRTFVDDALAKVPTLGLSEIQLKRESSSVPILEARLMFVLYLRDAP